MPFEVQHIRGIEEVKLRLTWTDEEGKWHKRGIILEITPDELPEVPEACEYPRVFLSRQNMDALRVQ